MQSLRATTCTALRSKGISTSMSTLWTTATLGDGTGALGVLGRAPGTLLRLGLRDHGGLQQAPGAVNGRRTGVASSAGGTIGGVEQMVLLCGLLGSLDLGVCNQCTVVLHCGRWSRERRRGQGAAIRGLAAMVARATVRQVQSLAHGGELRLQQALPDRHDHRQRKMRLLLGPQRLVSSSIKWANSAATLWRTT